MKKIINRPEGVVSEMCHGLALAHPGLTWDPNYNFLRRSQLQAEKVKLISGGGSGHEPAHAGFVGHGMLDAAVCGDVFASPSQIQVYQAIQATKGEKGTLLIIKNYSGDMMNFKNAAYLAQEDGIQVDYVKVDDDIAVEDSLYTVGHRGVAGTIFVHKIAGAAAQRGWDLAQVKAVAQRTAQRVRSIGFALTSCTVPAKGSPTFSLEENEMEFGVGIHGEPGIRREPLTDADTLAARMADQLLSALDLTDKQAQVAILVNGLGGTPLQELYLLNHSLRQALAQTHPGIQVVFSLVGNYMTSIDMAGASISILHLDDTLRELLFDPCDTAALKLSGPVPPVDYFPIPNRDTAAPANYHLESDPAWSHVENDRFTLQNMIFLVDAMSDCIIANEIPFCELDSHAGDGDFGMSVAKGFRRLKERWNEVVGASDTLYGFLHSCSMIIMEHCGGASGPIWGSAFRAAARYCQGKDALDQQQFAQMLQAVVLGIQATGERSFGRGAQIGDKTLMDALIPCAQCWTENAGKGLSAQVMFRLGAQAAAAGAKYTETIVARMGRAGTVGERILGYPGQESATYTEREGTTMDYQLELTNIAKHYKNFVAVDGVDLQIAPGEIVSLLGSSGCGKTTTLRMVAGLIEPTHGTIRIQGQDMAGIPPHKRDISMVFQNYALFPHLTVYENIVYGLKMRKIRDKKVLMERAREMMDIVQLSGVENRLPRELSGGQQQRVSLARAMIVKPKVMLFDEPLSNLDAKLRERTRVEIRNLLKRMNVTAIYVTHDQEEALTISDRIAVMNKGKIEQITVPAQLYTHPATRFIAGFVGHANFFEGTVAAVQDDLVTVNTAGGHVLQAAIPQADRPAVGEAVTLVARPENIRVEDLTPDAPNQLSGRILARIYLGSTIRYLVDAGEGKELEVDLQPKYHTGLQEGDTLRFSVDPGKLILVDR